MKMSLFLAVLVAALAGCEKKPNPADAYPEGMTYYPIHLYVKQQADYYAGQPLTFYKISTLNGKRDSMLTNINKIDWAAIYKTFIAADISDRKFLGKYKYSEFYEPTNSTNSMVYEAQEDDLFTRRFMVNKDSENGRITSVFIQTEKGSKREGTKQMLYYNAGELLQIQEQQWTKAGTKGREMTVEYRFM